MYDIRVIDLVSNDKRLADIYKQLSVHLGKVTSLEPVSGGLVHHVIRVRAKEDVYLKFRGDSYASLPHISTSPDIISSEARALSILNQHAGEYFPDILHFDRRLMFLLLSEVMPAGRNWAEDFKEKIVRNKDIEAFGVALGDIHFKTASFTSPVRRPNDYAFSRNQLKYTIGRSDHPLLVWASEEHLKRSTHLILGDVSPKNLFVRKGVVRFCDFETVRQGCVVFDQGWAIAHLILHSNDTDGALRSVRSFVEGYQKKNKILIDDPLMIPTICGVLLYRLDNDTIPYDLSFNQREKEQMAKRILEALSNALDLEKLIKRTFES
jgi:5-methylthioribose kinase